MSSQRARGITGDGHDAFDGLMTLLVVALAVLAFDDITTDTATTFVVEWGLLTAAAAWAAVLTLRLAHRGDAAFAAFSFVCLCAALWGRRAIGPGTRPSWQPAYVAVVGALAGYVVIAVALLVRASGTARHASSVDREVSNLR